ELANAAPDRSHNEEIDILLTTGIVGEVSYLALLATCIWRMIVLLRRARSLRSVLIVSALMGAFVGHIVEGATGIAFSATLILLWSIAALATALSSGAENELTAEFSSAVADDVITPPLVTPPLNNPPVRPPTVGRASPQRRRNGNAGSRSREANVRRPSRADQPVRAARYSFTYALSKLKTGSAALVALGAVGAVGALVLCVALFIGNIQLIAADADYRYAQNLEQESGNLVTQQSTYQKGLYGYQLALSSYQQALNQVPSWGWPPPQDNYSLFYGKTLLEYAAAILVDKTNKDAPAQATGAIEQALTVFTDAAHANPLNPDHPRNIAKLYRFWAEELYATPDIAKLKQAELYDAKASALAPHNADILDEWAQIDLELGRYDKANTHAWFAKAKSRLLAGHALDDSDGSVYRDLGTVYGQYAIWAEQAKDTKAAHGFYVQQANAWINALAHGATNYQQIYAPLATVYAVKLNNLCVAEGYAKQALGEISSGGLADPDGSIKANMQQIILNASADHKCAAKSP
ncbi:MAG: O-antigen ligase family protein, partial [Chloroflexota bacterium]